MRYEVERERIRRYYDQEYHVSDRPETVSPSYWGRLASRLGIGPAHRVLDVACGRGGWLEAVRGRGAFALGVDFSERAVAVAARRVPTAHFCCASADALPLADAAFDVVTCLGSLEHFLDVERALREMSRVATAGARFLFVVPNRRFVAARLGLFRGTQQSAVREETRTVQEWDALFQRAALRVERRWADLHAASWQWVRAAPIAKRPLRALQAAALCLLPLDWQYQVCFLCSRMTSEAA